MGGLAFHNTIGAAGQLLLHYEEKANSLEAYIIHQVMVSGKEYSPYDILELCTQKGKATKENSVRRALSNLKQRKKIWLTGKTVINTNYSKVPNKTYQLI